MVCFFEVHFKKSIFYEGTLPVCNFQWPKTSYLFYRTNTEYEIVAVKSFRKANKILSVVDWQRRPYFCLLLVKKERESVLVFRLFPWLSLGENTFLLLLFSKV